MTSKALFCYAVGLGAFSANRVLVSAFYAFQNTRTPVKIATIALFANVGFSLLLMGPLKHAGLALATSLASIIQSFILVFCLKRMPGVLHLRPIVISVFKSLAASAVMGLCLHFLFLEWQGTGIESSGRLVFKTGLLIVMGVLGYFALAMLLRCHELGSVKALISPLLRKPGGQ
jgi:putative peptidoglycan lipid II flippase